MKIFHITPDLNFAVKFVLPVAKLQAKNGNEVTLIYDYNEYKKSNELMDFCLNNSDGVRAIKINTKFRRNALEYLLSILKLIYVIRKESPDLLILHTSLDSFFPLILSRLTVKSRRIYFNHGVPFLGYKYLFRWILRAVERINILNANLVLTIGDSMRDCLRELGGHSKEIAVVEPGSACGIELLTPNFNDLWRLRFEARKKLKISRDERVVLFVGRPVRRKGFYDLIEAWDVFKNISSYRLILIGPSESELNIFKSINYSNIEILGYQADPTIFYLAADVLCIPSYHEGLGYCYLEAAAAGCVPICADVKGPTDFVKNNVNGLVCKPGEINSIRDCVSMLLNDKQTLSRLSERAFFSSHAYDRKKISKGIVEKIKEWSENQNPKSNSK